MDLKEGHIPYSPEEKYVEIREIISNEHKRSSKSLSLEYSVRKWKEDNEMIIHI